MQINCPKCQKPIELMETISFREAEESGVEKTQIAQGVFCPDCGLIPFEFQSPVRSNKSIVPPEELISHFRLLKPLGQGGFGVVWLAKDVNLDRLVALKMPFTNKSSVADLLHEAQSAAKLRHPNIVSVFETGQTEQGQAFIASEYIEGLNLKDVLSAGRPTLETAIELMVTISDALHHAHQYGIIHRDVKPANIMIDREGIPYVADFGLAKRVSEESESSKGSIVGTAHYMSPEQAAGEDELTNHRTDIYASGVMLFQMLTGELPFRGNTQAVMFQKSRQDAPSPRLLRPSIPKDLETLCLKCLERDPEKRYDSALILKEELKRVQRGEPIIARPVGPIERAYRTCKRYRLISGLSLGLVASLLIGLIATSVLWKNAERSAKLANETVYRSQMSLASQNYVQGDLEGVRATINRIASSDQLSHMREFSWHYYDRLLDTFSLSVNHGDQIVDLSISNDNRLLATVGFEGHCALWKIESGERLARERPADHEFTTVAFSPARLQLATGDSQGLVTFWNPNNLELPLKSIKHGPKLKRVRFSRDGRRILSFGARGAVRVWDVDSEQLIAELASGPQGTNVAEFSHDGTRIVTAGDQGILRLWSVTDPKPILEIKNGPDGDLEPIHAVCFSSDDSRLAVGGGHGFYRIYSSADGEVLTEKIHLSGKNRQRLFSQK